MAAWPSCAAMCSAVSPPLVRALTSAPLLHSMTTMLMPRSCADAYLLDLCCERLLLVLLLLCFDEAEYFPSGSESRPPPPPPPLPPPLFPRPAPRAEATTTFGTPPHLAAI